MTLIELFLIAVGLSMDAFAVSICKGLCQRKFLPKQALIIGLFFGGFQAGMPLLGWALGTSFASAITTYDHWVAFVLLGFIGGKMVHDALQGDDAPVECPADGRLNYKELLILSVATSIDALAVGITFAFLQVNIIPAVSLIGLTTLALSFVGVWVGNKFGAKYKSKAELAGGIILILIGLKILLEHLGFLTF